MKSLCPWLLFLTLLPVSVQAQQTAITQALKALPLSSVGDGNAVIIVIFPAPLPDAGQPQDWVPTPENIAEHFGRADQWFGHVCALAPPTMTALNAGSVLANLPMPLLAAHHPMPFLLGSLSAGQVSQMGATGLAFRDLTADQAAILAAMFPQPFQVVAKSVPLPVKNYAELIKPGADRRKIEAQFDTDYKAYETNFVTIPLETLMSSVRLHAYLQPQYNFDVSEDSTIDVDYAGAGMEKAVDYFLPQTQENTRQRDKPLQDLIRAEVPNTPKPGDILWNRHDLDHDVLCEGVKTIDELILRLAQATGMELYADRRYGALPVVLAGDLHKPQEARDIMQALALCVCGTWRQVGPAYVLTDDVQGMGTRRAALEEAAQGWSNRLVAAGQTAGSALTAGDWLHVLPFAPGDIGALTPSQMTAFPETPGGKDGHLLWKDLNAPLQAALRAGMASDDETNTDYNESLQTVARQIKPTTPVSVTFRLQMALELPPYGLLPLGSADEVPMLESTPPKIVQMHSVPVTPRLRGVLIAPKTADEARAAVAHLPKSGFHLLFLDVFTGGRTYFPNDALPPSSDAASGVLQAALEAAKPLHISVYAVFDTLSRRKDGNSQHPAPWPTSEDEDLTLSGEPADVAARRQSDAGTRPPGEMEEYLGEQNQRQSWTSPLDPHVRHLLPMLVRRLAGVKGLAGLVFQDTAPPGYLGEQESDAPSDQLGYTLTNRLAYLRAQHIDPIDLGPYTKVLFVPLPGSDTFTLDADIPTFALKPPQGGYQVWNKFRADANQSLLADCFTAARAAAPALPLWIREERLGLWIAAWRDPKKPALIPRITSDNPPAPFPAASLLCLPYGSSERTELSRFSETATDLNTVYGKQAIESIFDLAADASPDKISDTLDTLALLLAKP